jgi:hypothetical protein
MLSSSCQLSCQDISFLLQACADCLHVCMHFHSFAQHAQHKLDNKHLHVHCQQGMTVVGPQQLPGHNVVHLEQKKKKLNCICWSEDFINAAQCSTCAAAAAAASWTCFLSSEPVAQKSIVRGIRLEAMHACMHACTAFSLFFGSTMWALMR